MKIKKKKFKYFKDKYENFIYHNERCIENTKKKLSDYKPEYGPKEDLNRDLVRYFSNQNLLLDFLEDIEMLEGKR